MIITDTLNVLSDLGLDLPNEPWGLYVALGVASRRYPGFVADLSLSAVDWLLMWTPTPAEA